MLFGDEAADRRGRREVVAPAGDAVAAEVVRRRVDARGVAGGAVRSRIAEDDQELARQGIASAGRRRGGRRPGRSRPRRRPGCRPPGRRRRRRPPSWRGRREHQAVRDEARRQQRVRRVAGPAERHGRVVLEVDRGEAGARDRELDRVAEVGRVGLGLGDRDAHAARRVDRDDDVRSGRQAVERQGLVDRGGRPGGERHRHRAGRQRVDRRDRNAATSHRMLAANTAAKRMECCLTCTDSTPLVG